VCQNYFDDIFFAVRPRARSGDLSRQNEEYRHSRIARTPQVFAWSKGPLADMWQERFEVAGSGSSEEGRGRELGAGIQLHRNMMHPKEGPAS
jgi:hypothetical protein